MHEHTWAQKCHLTLMWNVSPPASVMIFYEHGVTGDWVHSTMNFWCHPLRRYQFLSSLNFGPETYRQKVMHESLPGFSTGGINTVSNFYDVPHLIGDPGQQLGSNSVHSTPAAGMLVGHSARKRTYMIICTLPFISLLYRWLKRKTLRHFHYNGPVV